MAEDKRLPLQRVSGSGFAPGEAPIWDGRVFKPGTAGGPIHVGTAEPATYTTGTLWYDTDDTC